jgi:hypothetical protein
MIEALSCTLFLLAIEPLIRNIQNCYQITPIRSLSLSYTWPIVYGYADDITCVINNDSISKQALINEYETFTRISGLHLNADKTEIYEFGEPTRPNMNLPITHIMYLNESYQLRSVSEIKMNGVYLCQNAARFKELNVTVLINKMERHFSSWSKRNLSLLGKIQIFKTFGLSQFLYNLSILEPNTAMWKTIENKIQKFLWNRNYFGNTAPARLKKDIMGAPICGGGFGMVDIKQVVTSVRLRRHFTLLEQDIHPLHHLINCLIDPEDFLCTSVELEIDEVTAMNLSCLRSSRLKYYEAPEWQLETDLMLQIGLLKTKIENVVRPRKLHSRELTYLKRLGYRKVQDLIAAQGTHVTKLIKISRSELTKGIAILARVNNIAQHEVPIGKLRYRDGRWIAGKLLPSKKIREMLFGNDYIAQPKILVMDEYQVTTLYKNIAKLINVPNKTKMLRLIHGDVYTAERRVRFGMDNCDTCRRCFMKETILHLLLECPYSLEVYKTLNLTNLNPVDLIGTFLAPAVFEIRTEIIISLIFRLQVMPPEILVRSILEKYANGLANKQRVKLQAEWQLSRN